MSAPLIGMSFLPFLALLIFSAIAAAIVHWAVRYRLFEGVDGYLAQWAVAWLGAWLGPAVLGHWSPMLWHIHILPALLGAFAGAFCGTVNARLVSALATPGAAAR